MSQTDGSGRSVITMNARYVPIDIKLEPRESINSKCDPFRCWDCRLIEGRYGSTSSGTRQRYRIACGG
jgi:hypothetical protein